MMYEVWTMAMLNSRGQWCLYSKYFQVLYWRTPLGKNEVVNYLPDAHPSLVSTFQLMIHVWGTCSGNQTWKSPYDRMILHWTSIELPLNLHWTSNSRMFLIELSKLIEWFPIIKRGNFPAAASHDRHDHFVVEVLSLHRHRPPGCEVWPQGP